MASETSGDERLGGRQAVVIGGSVAGLLAARVLSDHFDEVTIVERDPLPEGAVLHRGAPQARHVHVLLERGLDVIEGLFPGFGDELAARGAVRAVLGRTNRWYHDGGFNVACEGGPVFHSESRPLLEGMIRARVRALPNVHVRDALEVTGLLPGESGPSVGGVRVRAPGGEEELSAELVVDASGRSSAAPAWLAALGHPEPERSTVKVYVGYASRLYRRPDPYPYSWNMLYVVGSPHEGLRMGAVCAIEDGQWIVSLGGLLGDYPPDDEAGFLEFARSLPSRDVHDAIAGAEPLGKIAVYRFPSHLRRRYERMKRMPEGFVAMGDSLCSFNPIYGQGMTVAALSALALGERLCAARRDNGPGDVRGLARSFHARAAEVVDGPWAAATGQDFRYPGVEGQRPRGFTLSRWYLEQIHELNLSDPDVVRRYYRVMNLLAPPGELYHPAVLARVLVHVTQKALHKRPRGSSRRGGYFSAPPSRTAPHRSAAGASRSPATCRRHPH